MRFEQIRAGSTIGYKVVGMDLLGCVRFWYNSDGWLIMRHSYPHELNEVSIELKPIGGDNGS